MAEDIPQDIKSNPVWLRLDGQLQWYDNKSRSNQRWYRGLTILQIVLATSIPGLAFAPLPGGPWPTAVMGFVVAVSQAIAQLYQFGPLWIEYRTANELLKAERTLFLAGSGPYRDLDRDEALRLLAEQVEGHVAKEHEQWVRKARRVARRGAGGKEHA